MLVDLFRDEQSPLSLGVLDNMRSIAPGQNVQWPGLLITAPKKPYLIVPESGARNPIMSDSLQFLLRADDGLDLGLMNPTMQTCDDAQDNQSSGACLRRTITDYGQLHFNTKWSQYEKWQDVTAGKAQGSMEALLVRGSPYITMKFSNLLVILGTPQLLLFTSCKNGVCNTPNEANRESDLTDPDKLNTVTGQLFKIVIGSSSNRNKASQEACSTKNGGCEIPYLYSVYMVYTSEPITLAFEDSKNSDQIDKSYLKTGHLFALLRSVSADDCKRNACKTVPFNGTLRVAYVGSLPGPDHVAGINLIEDSKTAYNNAELIDAANLLTRYANVYPTKADLKLEQNGNSDGNITFDFFTREMVTGGFDSAQDNSKLLMTSFKSGQLSALKKGTPSVKEENYIVPTLKGDMVGVTTPISGNQTSWTQKLNFPCVLARSDNQIWFV